MKRINIYLLALILAFTVACGGTKVNTSVSALAFA